MRNYPSRRAEARSLIAQLETKSHVSAAIVGRSQRDSDGDIGGNRPSGGIQRKDDREPEFLLKSADHFRRRYAKCRTDRDVQKVIDDVYLALEAWMKTPEPAGNIDPEPGSFRWKCKIADSDKPIDVLLDEYAPISRATIYRYRLKYRGLRKQPLAITGEV